MTQGIDLISDFNRDNVSNQEVAIISQNVITNGYTVNV